MRLSKVPLSNRGLSAYSPTAKDNIPDNRRLCKQNLGFSRMNPISPDSTALRYIWYRRRQFALQRPGMNESRPGLLSASQIHGVVRIQQLDMAVNKNGVALAIIRLGERRAVICRDKVTPLCVIIIMAREEARVV